MFLTKNIDIFQKLTCNFNEMLTNDVDSFEQWSPALQSLLGIMRLAVPHIYDR